MSNLLKGFQALNRERRQEWIDDAVAYEQELNIVKAVSAMLEAGIKEEKIKELLIKHWNLRPSKATYFLQKANKAIK